MSPEKFTILIVDDLPNNIQIIGNLLRNIGYKIEFATNGNEALRWVKQGNFDLILLDIMMPEMSGFEVCEELKKDTTTSSIPVIFLTAKTDAESIINGFNIGAVDYITKPFNSQELLSRVHTHLDLQWKRKELERLNAEKDKLFSIVAHDIKNPFTSLLTSIELLENNYSSIDVIKRKEKIFGLFNEIKRIVEISANLLQWSKNQSNLENTNFSGNNLLQITNNVMKLYATMANNKEIDISIDIPSSFEVFADRKLIEIAIGNIVSNAIKFSHKQSMVQIYAKRKAEFIDLYIKDSGIGMSTEILENIFNISNNTNQLGTENEKGSGLGLLIVSDIVKANKGTINIESSLDEGTTVIVRLLSDA